MDNKTCLDQVDKGYRMPKPTGIRYMEVPDALYDIMLSSWQRAPEKRPTFEYLKTLFEDCFIATEGSYRDADGF